MKFVLICIAAFLLTSCATAHDSNYSQIRYKAGPCFGFCPMFEMTINPDRSAVIEADRFTFERGNAQNATQAKEGTFKTNLRDADYSKLITLINDLNVKSLNTKNGNRDVTDLPTAYLTVKHSDGAVTAIEDYGKAGTEKLKNLYRFIEDLRFSQTWTKVK